MDIETLEKELQNARRIIEEKDKIIARKDEIIEEKDRVLLGKDNMLFQRIEEIRKELLGEIKSNDDKTMKIVEFLKQLSQVTRGIHEKTEKIGEEVHSAKFVIGETIKTVGVVLSEARESFKILKSRK